MKESSGKAPRVAVMGAGAVGCYYGGMLARAGADVTLIGRPAHVEAVRAHGLRFEAHGFEGSVPMRASTDAAAADGADLVLFCVKSTDTEEAARSLAPHLREDSLLLALQNGVDNPPRIAAHVRCAVVPAVVYVACFMAGPGHLRHTGRGDLVIGSMRGGRPAPAERLGWLADTLAAAGVPTKVSDNVEGELWGKLVVNCAYNPLSALGRARYKRLVALDDVRDLMRAVVRETLAVAAADGVTMPPGDWEATVLALAASMPETFSSTAQDLQRGRRTEIDHLNGYVAARGKALGVDTPVNRTLHALVKLVEDGLDQA